MCRSKEDGGLGFRDVGLFNQAMLAKHECRLLCNLSSLVARVLKARIGDGRSISVYKDQLLPRPPSFRIRPVRRLPDQIVVSDLMEKSSRWSEPLLNDCFDEEEAEIILGIPISCSPLRDSWLWHFDMKGSFSVRSTYKIAWNLQSTSEASSSLVSPSWWKKLCLLNLPWNQILYGDAIGSDGSVWEKAVDFVNHVNCTCGTSFENPLSFVVDHALEVVNLCNRKTLSNGDMGNTISDIQKLVSSVAEISVIHVSQNCNKAAHAAAS
ncbi:hypothetical protein Dsin_021630 [Dipteronia sinensis]|uniref:RNase H type-1 domain-containing protein n=1 Tax=Dipteronia sinensis TaxID=43782 RepID=A0AAE0A0I6_9ROSI|nr:hypothetical protein Dsin_021630 [Dipteronia sinensis]